MCLRTLVLAAIAVTTLTMLHSSPLFSDPGRALDHRADDGSDQELIPNLWRLRHGATATEIRYGLLRLKQLCPVSRIVWQAHQSKPKKSKVKI